MITKRTPYNEPYIPKYQETIKFFVWQSNFFVEENKPAEFHFQLIDFLERPEKKKSVSATRGGSKSTIIGIYWLLRLAWRRRKKGFKKDISFALYLMDTATKVKNHFERLVWNIENEDSKIKNYFEIVRRTISKDGCIVELKRLDIGKTFTIAGLAMGQNIRSLNIKNKRPEIIICDDIENADNTKTEEARQQVRDWFYKDVEPAGILGVTEFIFIGTPLHADAMLLRQQKSKSWLCCNFPLAEKMPVPDVNEIISCWEDRFSKQAIMDLYNSAKEDGELKSFMQERMLDISTDEMSIYNLEKIRKYNPKNKYQIAKRCARYLSIDLAAAENANAHYSSLAILGINYKGDVVLLDGVFGRFSIDMIIEWAIKLIIKWNIDILTMEQVLFQKAYKWIFEQKIAEYALNVDIITFSKSKKNTKLEVFKSFAPKVNKSEFIVPDLEEYPIQDMDITDTRMKKFLEELINNEMKYITNYEILAEYDDLLDSIAQITQIPLEYGDLPINLDEEPNSIKYKNPYA